MMRKDRTFLKMMEWIFYVYSNEEVLKEQEIVIENIDSYLRAKKQLNEREA